VTYFHGDNRAQALNLGTRRSVSGHASA
jgi:hypothetical protein